MHTERFSLYTFTSSGGQIATLPNERGKGYNVPLGELLWNLGQDGWEMVSSVLDKDDEIQMFFKRPAQNAPAPSDNQPQQPSTLTRTP
jgi:hypothetical protein